MPNRLHATLTMHQLTESERLYYNNRIQDTCSPHNREYRQTLSSELCTFAPLLRLGVIIAVKGVLFMILPLNADQLAAFRAFLSSSEDAQPLGGEEYSCDLYDLEPPISMELALTDQGVEVLAAAQMAYDQGMDGWYLTERIEDMQALSQAMAPWLETLKG